MHDHRYNHELNQRAFADQTTHHVEHVKGEHRWSSRARTASPRDPCNHGLLEAVCLGPEGQRQPVRLMGAFRSHKLEVAHERSHVALHHDAVARATFRNATTMAISAGKYNTTRNQPGTANTSLTDATVDSQKTALLSHITTDPTNTTGGKSTGSHSRRPPGCGHKKHAISYTVQSFFVSVLEYKTTMLNEWKRNPPKDSIPFRCNAKSYWWMHALSRKTVSPRINHPGKRSGPKSKTAWNTRKPETRQ